MARESTSGSWSIVSLTTTKSKSLALLTADAFFWQISRTCPDTSDAEEVSDTDSIPLQVILGKICANISALRDD